MKPVSADVQFEAALREFLESFRLPGESQQIFRILEVFSRQYYQQCGSDTFNSVDQVLMLAFSLVLLNTDCHNHQVQLNRFSSDRFEVLHPHLLFLLPQTPSPSHLKTYCDEISNLYIFPWTSKQETGIAEEGKELYFVFRIE